jgi:hypothetical protein
MYIHDGYNCLPSRSAFNALAHGLLAAHVCRDQQQSCISPFMRSSSRLQALYWLPACAFFAKMASLAWARFLTSPCLPFCSSCQYWSLSPTPSSSFQHRFPCPILDPHPGIMRTSHLANLRSDSPRFSAASLLSSLSERRTTRAATVR